MTNQNSGNPGPGQQPPYQPPPPGQQAQGYQQPQYQQPQYQQPVYNSGPQMNPNGQPAKQRLVYILLGIFVGVFGAHNFYAGYTQTAIIQLVLSIVGMCLVIPYLIVFVWVIIEICTVDHDADGYLMV